MHGKQGVAHSRACVLAAFAG